jgi:hypothetical protein
MKISLSSARLESRLKKLGRDLPKQIDKALGIVASEGARNIQDRGLRGKGYKGSFEQYSPAYAKFRQKKGRNVYPVDLNFTGKMWAGLSSRNGSGFAEIYFSNADANRKAYFNNKKRPFFGFNSSDKKKLMRFFEKQIKI